MVKWLNIALWYVSLEWSRGLDGILKKLCLGGCSCCSNLVKPSLGVAQRPQPVVYIGAEADILENLIGRTLRLTSQT